MKRLPALAFAGMAAATVFAFFLTQHLKVGEALILGNPKPIPTTFNPVNGRVCLIAGERHNFRKTRLTIELPHPGTVGVYVINDSGDLVATVNPGMALPANHPGVFRWNGLESDGKLAADGTYFIQLSLLNQGRTINLDTPVTILTHPPHPKITSVKLTDAAGSLTTSAPSEPPVLTPGVGTVTVRYRPGEYRSVTLNVYRVTASGRLLSVDTFAANRRRSSAIWNGDDTAGEPVPAGTYVIGTTVEDEACNRASYVPTSSDEFTVDSIVVQYIVASPPLTAVAPRSDAAVSVRSPAGPYTWTLRRVGQRKLRGHGSGPAGQSTLHVRLPKAGRYTLRLRTGDHSVTVPLVAATAGH